MGYLIELYKSIIDCKYPIIKNMKYIILLVFVAIAFAKEHPEAKLYFTEYCRFYNYPVEIHDITTQDGYILRVFRIQKKATQIKAGAKPVLMQHGLLDSSDTWLINDEDKAPAFMLANEGYDVWLGNSRGNKHSRKHTKYNPDKDAEFWQFSFQHMADYDLPAVFQYISNYTSQKLHYIGHSQGTIQMHVALSKRNAVVEQNLDKYFAFGPVAFVSYVNSSVMNLIMDSPALQWYHLRHIHEFMPSLGWFKSDLGVLFCATFPKSCGDVMAEFMGADPSFDNYDRYDVLVGHDPSGTSVMNMEHWRQIKQKKNFLAYDYGSAKANNENYGQSYPPQWHLQNIRVPIRLFAGSADDFADLVDVNYLWSSLAPEAKQFMKVYNADHCTFMWGREVNPWMNDVMSMMAKKHLTQQ